MRRLRIATLQVILVLLSTSAFAQSEKPGPVIEVSAGYAGFLDEDFIDHAVLAAAFRLYLLPRVSVGPEVAYMIGPNDDRDLFLTGNLTFDLLGPRGDRARTVTPFLVVGGGLMRHSDRFGSTSFSSTEGAFTAGGGVRARVSDRVFAGADFRVGWEPHFRVTGILGVELSR